MSAEKPFTIPRDELYKVKQEFLAIAEDMGPKIELPNRPDHKVEARVDCAITFLEEGLFPMIHERVTLPSSAEILQTATKYITRFITMHPNDFDISDPIQLVELAEAQLPSLRTLFSRKESSPANQTFVNLIEHASTLLGIVMDEHYEGDSHDTE